MSEVRAEPAPLSGEGVAAIGSDVFVGEARRGLLAGEAVGNPSLTAKGF